MAEITASAVKSLREDTGQGMMECKKALQETNGDIEAAKDLLRKRAGAKAEKKAERATSEGLVAVAVNDDLTEATAVEVQCETDFCARNEVFQQMVDDVLAIAKQAQPGPVDAGAEITDAVQAAFAKIGENMSYSQGKKIKAAKVGCYLHHNNKVGVIVGIDKPEVDDETLSGVCMHIAFANPMGITEDDIPAEVVEREKKFATEEAVDSGKPQEIAEKIVSGKIRKFIQQNALMEQNYVRDESKTIREVLDGATVVDFARFAVGSA